MLDLAPAWPVRLRNLINHLDHSHIMRAVYPLQLELFAGHLYDKTSSTVVTTHK